MDAGALAPYGEASGPFSIAPTALAVPRDPADVGRLVRWAGEEGVGLVPRGAGTGMPAGNVGPGCVVDFTAAFREVAATTPDATRIRVGAGAVAARVEAAANAAGRFLPSLPSSAERCTLGGMIANNAAGARSFRYGATRAWVESLEVVLAGGETVTLAPGSSPPAPLSDLVRELAGTAGSAGPAPAVAPSPPAPVPGWPAVRKNASGYAVDRVVAPGPGGDGAAAVHLLVGSEGTLGLVTGAVLVTAPLPVERAVLLAGVPDPEVLPELVQACAAVDASACELLGRRILEMARLADDPELGALAAGAAGLLLVEVEGSAGEVEAALDRLGAAVRRVGARRVEARDPAAQAGLWDLRHRASPLIARAAARGLHSMQFIEDSVVPVDRLPAYLRGLDAILAEVGLDAVVFGHAGDGNLHVNPLVDVGRPHWREDVRRVLEEVVVLVAGLGGTLTGEHGDGRLRAPCLHRIWAPHLVAAFRRVKDVLDPRGVLNPGVVLPLPGQDPLDGLGGAFP